MAAQPVDRAGLPPALAGVRYAGFWIRVVAATLDWMLMFAALFPIRWLVGSSATLAGEFWQVPTNKALHVSRLVRIGFAVAAGFAYRAGMESSRFQGTLGKMAVQIKVTDLAGDRISLERASGRYLAKFLSTISLGVGYLMAGFTPRKQALHDRVAGTLVQYR